MKKVVSILCVAVMIVMIMSFAACDGSGAGANIDGTYTLTGMTVEGEDYSSYLSLLGDVTLAVSGTTATLTMYEETQELTVDTEAQTMNGNGTSIAYTVSGDTITLAEGETLMVFTKQ